MSQLPCGWTEAQLEDLLVTVLGGDWGKDPAEKLEDSSLARCIRASELRHWAGEKGKSAAIRRLKNSSLEKRKLKEGDILVEVSGGGPDQAVGRTVLITKTILCNDPTLNFVCTNFFRFCRPSKQIQSSYLNWYLTYFYRSGGTEELQGGSNNLRNLRFPDFISQFVPISPLNEQGRIVEKIETLFDEIDKGVESLQAAKDTLGLYRQSLLKAAFEGRLTAEWREKNADKLESPEALLARIKTERETRYKVALNGWQEALKDWRTGGEVGKKPAKPKLPSKVQFALREQVEGLPILPCGWAYFAVGSLCDVVRGGSPRPAGDKRYYEGDIPFLKVADLTRPKGRYVRKFSYTIKQAGLSKTRLVDPETLMISNSGATLGVPKVCKIEATFNDGIAAFLGLTPDENAFHYWFWVRMTPVLRLINQGAAQPNLNTTLLAEIAIPQCSPAEQAEIVRLLDEKLDAADALESEINVGLARAAALRQSILKKAFSGQLVSQDPTDEPASELLARIKVEKAEKERTAKRERKTIASRKPKAKVKRPTLTNLIEVLKKQKSWISASKAAQELGISDGASSDDVESFYRQLKEHLENKDEAIEVERRGDEDWLRLAKAEVS